MPLKIWYIEDELELCELFADLFSSEFVQIRTFSQPEEALAEVLRAPPDLIFLDFRLRKTTGDLVALQLPPEIPKYLITGDLVVESKYPFTAVLKKPIEVAEIQALLDAQVLSKRAA